MTERDAGRDPARTPEDVGAGTGASARDAGEEGTPAGGEVGALSDIDSEWATLGGEAPTEEGAAAGPARDEGAEETTG